MKKKTSITGHEVARCAASNGAVVTHHAGKDGKQGSYLATGPTGKAVSFSDGEIKPRAAFHLGKAISWILLVVGLIMAGVSAIGGPLSTLIR